MSQLSLCRPVLNPQILPRCLPEVALLLTWVSDPSSADGRLSYWVQLLWRRESGTAHKQLEQPLVEQAVSVRQPLTIMVQLMLQ